MKKHPHLPAALAILLAAAALLPLRAAASPAPLDSYEPWDPETVEIFSHLPVQDTGRMKPFDTLAQFTLFRLYGKRTMAVPVKKDGKVEEIKIGPTEWMLDVLFRSDLAKKFPTFQVVDSRIITAIGLEEHEERRDWYSYEEILPGRAKLSELGREYAQLPAEERTYDKNLLLNLASNVSDFEFLNNQFAFARDPIQVDPAELPKEVFGDVGESVSAVEMLARMDALRKHVSGDQSRVSEGLELAMRHLQFFADSGIRLAIFPPRDADTKEWLSCGKVIMAGIDDGDAMAWAIDRLKLIENLAAAVGDPAKFKAEAQALRDVMVKEAKARGEYGKIGMEVSFYKAKYFYRSLVSFFLAFLLMAFTWLAPRSRFAKFGTWGVVGLSILGLALLVAGVVIRSVIQSRAPIYNLYDTILCITAVAVLVSLLIEYLNRQRLGLAVAVILGVGGMFLAMRFEVKNAADTMESMRAVLASNFWLSTHVSSVIIGYSGGLLAAGIAHVYVFAKLFGVKKGDREFYRTATRMTYGVLCFALFFALVGTVLGGIWANYSWGRFWGWDPKENGALMIVLWCLIILHARMGGYVRDLGINLMAIVGGIIVSFSWWGVNQLGVGLHSYGFTDGIWGALMTFWCVELAVLGLGGIVWLRERGEKGAEKPKRGGTAPAAA